MLGPASARGLPAAAPPPHRQPLFSLLHSGRHRREPRLRDIDLRRTRRPTSAEAVRPLKMRLPRIARRVSRQPDGHQRAHHQRQQDTTPNACATANIWLWHSAAPQVVTWLCLDPDPHLRLRIGAATAIFSAMELPSGWTLHGLHLDGHAPACGCFWETKKLWRRPAQRHPGDLPRWPGCAHPNPSPSRRLCVLWQTRNDIRRPP